MHCSRAPLGAERREKCGRGGERAGRCSVLLGMYSGDWACEMVGAGKGVFS